MILATNNIAIISWFNLEYINLDDSAQSEL